MANRKRPIILRCPVTAEERSLIEQKMAQLQTKRIGAYLRKMAIDGYIIQVDTRDIKEMNKLLSAIGRNINQIAKRVNLNGHAAIPSTRAHTWPSLIQAFEPGEVMPEARLIGMELVRRSWAANMNLSSPLPLTRITSIIT